MVTESRRRLNDFLVDAASLLKREGFRKTGLDWTRASGDAIQAINLQASPIWDFHVNIGVEWPTVYELVGWTPPQRFTAKYAPGNVRLEELTAVAYRGSGEALARALDQWALPWLERALDPRFVASYTSGHWRIALLLVAGDLEAARRTLEEDKRQLEATRDPVEREVLESSIAHSVAVIDRWQSRQL